MASEFEEEGLKVGLHINVKNSYKNCVKFSLRLREIFLRIEWNSLNFFKSWVKFSYKLRKFLLKIVSNFLQN